MTLSTTGAASNGLVYLAMVGVDASGHTFTEQGSGVLLSADEVLTAAHLVYNDNGTLRTAGTAAVGYNGGSALAFSRVDGAQAGAKQDYATLAGIGGDFAVVHLSTPVTNGTVFSLGSDLLSGTFDVSGYPVGTSGTLDTKTEALTATSGTQVYTGGTLNDGTHNPAGSSGGSVYQIVDGAPTAYGIISADLSNDTSKGFFKQLTAADVAEIQSWVAAADSGTKPAASASNALAVSTESVAAGVSITSAASAAHSAPGFSTDIAAALAADAAGHRDLTGVLMTDVAAAITRGCQDGGTFAQMSQDAQAYLGANSSYAKRAIAYLGGLLAGTTGTWLGDVAQSANSLLGGSVPSGALSRVAAAGRAEGLGMDMSNTSALVDRASATLAGAIAHSGSWHDAAQTFRPMDAHPHSVFAFGASHHG